MIELQMKKNVFVVDDNNMNLFVVKETLKEHFKITAIPSAEKMFAILEKILPDLILLDIFMPDMDGFEAAQILKNNSKYADIPVIFLTSTIDDNTKKRGLDLGITDILIKPFLKDELIKRIRKYFGDDTDD